MSLGSQARPCGFGRARSILRQGEQMAPWGHLAESPVPCWGRVTLAGAGGVIPAQGKDKVLHTSQLSGARLAFVVLGWDTFP